MATYGVTLDFLVPVMCFLGIEDPGLKPPRKPLELQEIYDVTPELFYLS